MNRFLISRDILSKSILNHESEEHQFVIDCVSNSDCQPWILGTTWQELVNEGFDAEEISNCLKGISTIPFNQRLAQAALESEHGFKLGLLLESAKIFHLTLVVEEKTDNLIDGVHIVTLHEALSYSPIEPEKVDFLSLQFPLHPIFDQVDGWFMEIVQNTAFAGGNHVAEFEKEFAEFCGVRHAIGVSSGTDALMFALLAMGIGPGDEVITVPNTFIATTEAISQVGARPVFVDVSEGTYNINPDLIEEKITEHTKAILPVHLYGQIADMDSILAIAKKYDLKVLEDACQAHGAEYKGHRAGSMGDAAAFSMYPGKNLGAFGEAGCVVTNDRDIAKRIARLRDHGQSQKYFHAEEGYNGRMDNLQAASLRAKLPFLNGWNEKRRVNADLYRKHLGDMSKITLPVDLTDSLPVFHLFVVLVPSPKALHEYLKERNVSTGFHYPVPLHLQDAYQTRNEARGSYPVTEFSADRLLSLPMFPELTEQQVLRVCTLIKEYFA